MTSQGLTYVSKSIGVIALTPQVLLFIFALVLFPFISTVTGVSLKIVGLEVWKYLWLLWLIGLAAHIVRSKDFFDKKGGGVEPVLWIFITFMLVFAPVSDLVIDSWKNWFFCLLTVVLFRLMMLANSDEIWTMIKFALGLWWAYALILILYANSYPSYPGSIQHQFFLSGLLGLVAGLLLLSRYVLAAPEQRAGHGFYPFLLLTMLVNVVLNLTITEARSIFPFSLALALIAAAWLLRSRMHLSPRVALRFGLPLAILLTLLPLLHLSGAMGNLANELSYPIFGKLRSVESKTGREVAFHVWGSFLVENASLLGPAKKSMPAIKQEIDTSNKPLFGLTREQFDEVRQQGMQKQKEFFERQQALGLKQNEGTLAIAAPHNQWLDAAARSGLMYAVAIAWAFGYVIWLISFRLVPTLPAPLLFAYWSMAVAWGVASQFDDEHWLYHIPYLTLFFIPVIVSTLRMREPKPALDAAAAPI